MRWEMCTLTESLLTGSFRPLAALGDGWGGSLHGHHQGPRGPCVPTCVMGDLGVFNLCRVLGKASSRTRCSPQSRGM